MKQTTETLPIFWQHDYRDPPVGQLDLNNPYLQAALTKGLEGFSINFAYIKNPDGTVKIIEASLFPGDISVLAVLSNKEDKQK